MSFNRIAQFSTLLSENLEGAAESRVQGFTVNPLGSSLAPWQIQIYQAAFMKAQEDAEKDANGWGEWSI
jgi:hypothetical protein